MNKLITAHAQNIDKAFIHSASQKLGYWLSVWYKIYTNTIFTEKMMRTVSTLGIYRNAALPINNKTVN